jgi:Ca2+-binding RTX toxin-like protein
MLRRAEGLALAVLVAGSMIGAAVGPAAGSNAQVASATGPARAVGTDAQKTGDRPHAGPPYRFKTELMGEFSDVRIRDAVFLTREKHGYRFWAGGQDNHLVITRADGKLRFRDTGTKSIRKLAPACHRHTARPGILAVCRIPTGISERRPLLVEVWPRLGNDFVDASTLPATFAVTVLGDEGRDVARLGAGPDFFNGHSPRDAVWGGPGADWIRSGLGNDTVYGGDGSDDIVAMQGRDKVHAGSGDDRVGGAEGADRLWGDAGADFLLCGTGRDRVSADRADRIFHDCENVSHG